MVLDKNSILEELKLKTIEVPFGKGHVIVSELGAVDYVEANGSPLIKGVDGNIDFQLFKGLIVSRSIVDTEGNRVFADEDCRTLANGSKTSFKVLFEAIERINLISDEEAKN